jgi:hypothetical protein
LHWLKHQILFIFICFWKKHILVWFCVQDAITLYQCKTIFYIVMKVIIYELIKSNLEYHVCHSNQYLWLNGCQERVTNLLTFKSRS